MEAIKVDGDYQIFMMRVIMFFQMHKIYVIHYVYSFLGITNNEHQNNNEQNPIKIQHVKVFK